ncbi:hypothetical protein Tco_0626272 [Tanacetum coccineum]|uniref:Integrase, catalytic region, zinc finger, CCHC-type, peptidase aspartic, catalytic n=1 Tax=Tanacetum coccineum TaxID=301880 RepID=A0ABQ4WJ43_9ASTR
MDSMILIGQKNTLVEYMILSGADNRLPMLDKDLYDSWKSKMEQYMQNRENERMILELVEHGPLIWPTIEENMVTMTKKYAELSATEKIQADWESLHQYYLRFTQLINDMDIYKMKLEQFQVNTKFLNSLSPEWSKFMTDVNLVKDLRTTNFDQLHAYLQQHELHANEFRIMRERNHDPLALVSNHQQTLSHSNTYQSSYNNPRFLQQFSPSPSPQYGSIHPTQHYSTTYPSTPLAITYPSTLYPNAYTSTVHQDAYPQPQFIDSGLAVPVVKQGDDPIDSINKMMSFLSTVVTPRLLSTNNQLRNSSNLRQQATIHDERVTVQPVQERQTSFAAGMSGTRANISGTGGNNLGQQRFVKCFNCQGEAQGNGKVLNEEELEFLADPGIAEGLVIQTVITHNATYQADDLDAYDSDFDDFSIAKAVLMANLSSYRSYVLSEVPHSEDTHADMLNQSHLLETQNAVVQDTNSSAQQNAMILSVFKQLSNQVTNCNKVNKDNLIANESLSTELERYNERFADFEKEINYIKQTLSEQSKEKELLTETFNVFKIKSKEKEAKNIDTEIALEKKVKELDNICNNPSFRPTVISSQDLFSTIDME